MTVDESGLQFVIHDLETCEVAEVIAAEDVEATRWTPTEIELIRRGDESSDSRGVRNSTESCVAVPNL